MAFCLPSSTALTTRFVKTLSRLLLTFVVFSHYDICGTLVQGIFAKIRPDLELRWGDLISSPVDSIVSLVSPKKSYGPNSVGKNYFSATPFSLLAKNATGGHNA